MRDIHNGDQEAVQTVVEALQENVNFYRTAAKNAIHTELKQLCEARARQRQTFIQALDARTQVEVSPEDEGFLASVQRGLFTVKAAMTIERDKTDEVIIAESQEVDARLLAVYREALQKEGLPSALKERLEDQFNHIQAAYAYTGAALAEPDTSVVIALFATLADVQTAVEALQDEGVTEEQIALISREDVVADALEAEQNLQVMRETSGATMLSGSLIGSLLGLAAGAGVAIVMGIGAITVAGLPASLAVAAAGSGIGATYGGIFGALIGWGVAEDDTQRYLTGVREGQILLAVRISNERSEAIAKRLRRENGQDVTTRQQGVGALFEANDDTNL